MAVTTRLTLCVGFLAFCAGCGRPDIPLPSAAQQIVAEVEGLNTRMMSSQNKVRMQGRELVRRIKALPEHERASVSERYLKKIEALEAADVRFPRCSVRLYNLQGLLKTVDQCADYVADKELPMRLYAGHIDRCAAAARYCRGQMRGEMTLDERRSWQQTLRDILTDYRYFCLEIRKIYLPRVAGRLLSPERLDVWRKEFEDRMKRADAEFDAASPLLTARWLFPGTSTGRSVRASAFGGGRRE